MIVRVITKHYMLASHPCQFDELRNGNSSLTSRPFPYRGAFDLGVSVLTSYRENYSDIYSIHIGTDHFP